MELVGDIALKTGEPSLLTVEAAKASKARDIGKDSGLFSVPRVVNLNAETGVLEFERLRELSTLLELAVRKDDRLPKLLEKAGRALAVIHEKSTLPEEMKHEMPPAWMDDADENVFIHGDFACINVCFHEPSGELVILDFSTAPMVGRTPTYGSRYFDILLFISSLFLGAPCRKVFNWPATEMADGFLKGYACNIVGGQSPPCKLRKYSPEILRLQRDNIRLCARRKPVYCAPGFMACQILMLTRLRSFLRKKR